MSWPEMPTTVAPSPVISSERSRYEQNWRVQTIVSSPGEKRITTRSPRWSARRNRPSVPSSSKSGAASPTFGALAMRASLRRVDPWIQERAAAIAGRAERELEALVGVSSPSGGGRGAEAAAGVVVALLPDEAEVERVPCSSPDHAPDLVARVRGTGSRRIVLVGHLDTVVAHDDHQPLRRDGDKLVGSGSVDMKGGAVLAAGVLRALAPGPDLFAEIALLLVVDEEWRIGPFAHVDRFAGFDACLCFEAGELDAAGHDAVVVKRKAAGTVEVIANGRSAHSGSAPDAGINALLALAGAAQAIAAQHDPQGEDHLTAVPTVVRSGDAFNVVPASGRLIADVRADRLEAFARVLSAVPPSVGGATLSAGLARE